MLLVATILDSIALDHLDLNHLDQVLVYIFKFK